jgi:predicted HAD superfamily hydrolase
MLRTSPRFNGDISIIEIYDSLKEGLDISLSSEECADVEFSIDLSLLFERRSVTHALRKALSSGSEVWIVTDMYYTKKQIKNLLDQFSIPFNRLYVSSEVRLRKDDGGMWKMIKTELDYLDINALTEFIHIGDNIVSDIQIPQDHAIGSYHIMSPGEYSQYRQLSSSNSAFSAAERLSSLNPSSYSASLALLSADTLI